uniref:Putative secreted protein n=1 Tax=Anopheles darlingi TaxID=43151 RepID=A0A2M4DMY2_ANODA
MPLHGRYRLQQPFLSVLALISRLLCLLEWSMSSLGFRVKPVNLPGFDDDDGEIAQYLEVVWNVAHAQHPDISQN